ncbi:MAG: hypothetical protein ACREVK_02575 [Gammaproteobacteria bacterium]
MLKLISFIAFLVFAFVITFYGIVPWVTEFMQSETADTMFTLFSSSEEEDGTDRSDLAVDTCRQFVRAESENPTAADVPGQNHQTRYLNDGIYAVRSYATGDAGVENDIYHCVVRYTGGGDGGEGEWSLVSLKLGEK